MLAEVQPLSTDVFIPAPPSFTATFNPSPDPPASNQFSLTADGSPVANLIPMDTTTDISIKLTDGASFPTSESSVLPIVWTLPPDGGEPDFTVSSDGGVNNVLTLHNVSAPTHVLCPWVFRFIVDVQGVIGIRSQNIYLAKPFTGNPFFLKYAPDNGNFSLVDSLDSSQDGAILGAELVMVNTHYPTDPFIISVDLMSDPSITPTPVFPAASQAIVWSSGEQPLWIPDVSVSGGGSTLSFIIDPSLAMGRSISLQFAIVLNNGTPDSMTILSPDPIIINATIGDG